MTRWLLALLVVVGCSPNYCPSKPIVFAVIDPRLMEVTESAVSQLAPHLPVPVSVVAIADVATRQWNGSEVWTVESVVEGETFTSACNPVAGKPNTFVGAETSPEHQAIFVCEFDIEAGATRLVLHEIGHVFTPDHSDDPRDIMHRVPADRSTYSTNDIALLTATCG